MMVFVGGYFPVSTVKVLSTCLSIRLRPTIKEGVEGKHGVDGKTVR